MTRRARRPRAAGTLAAICLVHAACAARGFTPPTGAGTKFAEAPAVWQALTARCRDARVFVAEIRVDGWVGPERQRIPGTAMHGALTRQGEIYLEVPAPLGPPGLSMAGRADAAVFLLPREHRVLRAPAADILEAITGLHWGPVALLDVLSGCVAQPGPPVTGERFADVLSITVAPDITAWFHRLGASWQLRAASVAGLWVEYRRYGLLWPEVIHIRAASDAVTPLALTFVLDQIQVNIALDAGTFVLDVPSSAQPMTLAELRAAGPLGEKK